jgi:hypothetical protein
MLPRTTLLPWLSGALLLLGATVASATTLNVAAGGIDADGCGTAKAPCRSITRALAAAAAGDKILVGPGRYGDLDADGTLGEAGEEGTDPTGLVVIDKPVVIESVEGAATTVLDAAGANVSAVVITASGARLGKAKKGFTVTGSLRGGVAFAPQVTGTTVAGCRAVRNALGFGGKAGGNTLVGNVAEANTGDGFAFTGGRTTFTACRATGNEGSGFTTDGEASVLKGCVASANAEDGFRLQGSGTVLTNSVGNGNRVGLRASDVGLVLTTNSFLGNTDAGIVVTAPNVTITNSNVFGNGAAGGNCGVTTAGNGSANLDGVCFGAPTGPGDDPADDVCSGAITVIQVIEKVIKITPKVPL